MKKSVARILLASIFLIALPAAVGKDLPQTAALICLNRFDAQDAKTNRAVSESCRSEDGFLLLVGQAVGKFLGAPIKLAMAGDSPAAPQTAEKTFTNSIGMEFVLIAAGKFTMGSPANEEGRYGNEGPQHEVEITRPFYMGRYEVTQAQWQQVMGENPSYFKDCGGNCPVENISWHDARDFISRLNEREGVTDKYRFPTEAEWEYACRAGTRTAYTFGDDAGKLDEYAWHEKNSEGRTHPVGQKKANSWGLYDMHGNVLEWCFDRYDAKYYRGSPSENPTGPKGTGDWVSRGGNWFDVLYRVRCAWRGPEGGYYGDSTRGLRLVRVID